MRIAFLMAGTTGYATAQLRALHRRGHEVLAIAPRLPAGHQTDTSFTELGLEDVATLELWDTPPANDELVARLRAFGPDAVVMVSWNLTPAYRAVMSTLPATTVRFLVMDNLWRATPRQWLGRLTHRLYVDPLFDAALVPSERTEFYARRLGFGVDDVVRGSLSADTDLFREVTHGGGELQDRRRFLYVGRLAWHKGADVLIEAYRRYRASTTDPWALHVAGIGELEHLFRDQPGVTMLGFQQPEQVRERMLSASALVVPSHIEPYGVVVHEATLSGLPILLTDFAGAAPGLVQDGYNGWHVPNGDVTAWAAAMHRMSALDADRLGAMSIVSASLSRRLSSAQWAQNLEDEIERRRARGGGRLSPANRLHPRNRPGTRA